MLEKLEQSAAIAVAEQNGWDEPLPGEYKDTLQQGLGSNPYLDLGAWTAAQQSTGDPDYPWSMPGGGEDRVEPFSDGDLTRLITEVEQLAAAEGWG